MLRNDGTFTIYVVQHQYNRRGEWADSALDVLLFDGLDYQDRRGELGDKYRALIHADSESWQQTGLNGYLDVGDAHALRDALEAKGTPHRFRVIERTISQTTKIVPHDPRGRGREMKVRTKR